MRSTRAVHPLLALLLALSAAAAAQPTAPDAEASANPPQQSAGTGAASGEATRLGRPAARAIHLAGPSGASNVGAGIAGNTTPVIVAAAALTRQAGSPAGAAVVIANTSDVETPAGLLVVTPIAGGTATGITVSAISNSNGTVSAMVSASCTATSGTVRLQSSDGIASATADLQVDVTANTQPALSYRTTELGRPGGTLVINPFLGPSDNGSVTATTLQSRGTYTGTATVGATNGVVTLSNMSPEGRHNLVIRVTDNCGTSFDAGLLIRVASNTEPTIFTNAEPAVVERGASPGASQRIGFVFDLETPVASLAVTSIAGGTTTGGVVQDITIGTGGEVRGRFGAACGATGGTLRFQVSDGTFTASDDLLVAVVGPFAPIMQYNPAAGLQFGNLVVSPRLGPEDQGATASTTLESRGTYTGGISVGPANGVVTLSNLQPAGSHEIIIRITDNCGASALIPLTLDVAPNGAPTFVPVANTTLARGTVGSAPVVLGTVADVPTAAAALTVTQVGGGTATGVAVRGLSNDNGTVRALLDAACDATSGTLRFQVGDGLLTGTADLPVSVVPNQAPTLSYAAQTGVAGSTMSVAPLSGPSDTGPIALSVPNRGTYTGTIAVDPVSGVVGLANLQPVGTHTITIRATDGCAVPATTDTTLTLTVVAANTAPTFAPANAQTIRRGSLAGPPTVIGTVDDASNTVAGLVVAPIPGGSASGIIVNDIVNANGTISARVATACDATTGTQRFQVSDGALNGVGDLAFTIQPDLPPVLSYPAVSGAQGSTLDVAPLTGPSDNGTILGLQPLDPGTYTGGLGTTPSTGVIRLSGLQPAGTHRIRVFVQDTCLNLSIAELVVTVSESPMFRNGFESPPP